MQQEVQYMSNSSRMAKKRNKNDFRNVMADIFNNRQLYYMLLPVVAYFLIFHYYPMYGIQIAFKDFSIRKGMAASPWIGFAHFETFFNSYYFTRVLKNTFIISLYSLAAGFPMPIILALLMNEVRVNWFKRTVQTVTYAPYFISMVVMCAMVTQFLSPDTGWINRLIVSLGGEKVYFLGRSDLFAHVYVWSGIWQGTGWSSIIYMAALSSIDPQLHEAAMIDGAGRLRRIWHINLPGILPTCIILLIMNCGSILNVGFEKIFLLQNDLNRSSSEVISTLVYQQGLIQHNYGYSAAVGLFNSLVNCTLLITVNTIARKTGETSLW